MKGRARSSKIVVGLMVAAAVAVAMTMAGPATCLAQGQQATSPDRAYVNAVLDGLVKNGVLSAGQAAQIKANAEWAAHNAAAEAKTKAAAKPAAAVTAKKAWYDTLKASGYTQFRWQYHPDYPNVAAKSDSNEFLVRRARLKLTFQPTKRDKVYLHVDFSGGKVTVMDAWIQRILDQKGLWSVRVGQQKIPFGFEPVQSSSDRLPLEFNFTVHNMFPGNRETGAVVYYTRPQDRAAFAWGKKTGFGEGDYGSLALGIANGQGARVSEANSNKAFVVRLARPMLLGARKQYAEVGTSYWHNTYYSSAADQNFKDRLFGLHGYIAPKPWGVQSEYYDGETEGGDVHGWYGMGLFRTDPKGVVFARYDSFDGPLKDHGTDSQETLRRTGVGYAHQLDRNTKLTLEYDRVRVRPLNGEAYDDDLLGLQMQATY